MKLKGRAAVVIGASGGIGREIALTLASEGAEVILVARRKSVLSVLKSKITEKGGKAHIFTCDLSNLKSIEILSKQIRSKFKSIDLLLHAAGVAVYKKLGDVSLEEWEKSFSVNVSSVFLLVQKLLPLLGKSERAIVINIGSGAGKIPMAGRSAYCASKAALRLLTLSLAKEFRKTNIKFSLITLGSTLTSFGPLSLEDKKKLQKRGKRYFTPKWVAHNLVVKLKHDTLEDEVTLYPSHYFGESKHEKIYKEV